MSRFVLETRTWFSCFYDWLNGMLIMFLGVILVQSLHDNAMYSIDCCVNYLEMHTPLELHYWVQGAKTPSQS
jgi:hypothetical protein